MGEFKGTQINEPCGDETLYMYPSYFDDNVFSQTMCISPADPPDTVSFVCSKSWSNGNIHGSHFVQFFLLPSEIDLIIEALQKAKEKCNKQEGV